jgi:hypothetical protein
MVGGTASAIGGGKFANGAVSSAMVYLFNDVAKDLAGMGNTIRDISGKLNSDFEQRMFARYWNSKGDYKLTTSEFNDILGNSKVTNVNESSFTISLYDNKTYDYGIGSATVYYSSSNSDLHFYDNYNFDTKPWGSRSYSAEVATRMTHNEGRHHGATSFNIYN